jgi:4-hydroxy-3-methylbut-2-enyl diphosphate reductase
MSDEMELEATKIESATEQEETGSTESTETIEAVETVETAPEATAAEVEAESAETEETTLEETAVVVEMEAVEMVETDMEATTFGTEQKPVEIPEAAAEVEAVAEAPVEIEAPAEVEAPVEVAQAPPTPKPRGESEMDYSNTFRELTEGDVVPGVVVHIDKEGVLVDVGTKSEGIIRPHELSPGPYQSAEDIVSVGEKISVYVMETENQDGNLILSKKRADFEKAWERVQVTMEEKKVINAMVTDRVKGGLVVDLGIRGFVPASHVGSGKVKNLEKYIGQSLPLKVIEVDRERRKVVLSHRLATEEEREKKRVTTVASLAEGQVREGVIRRITDYGAFVDLGGIDGLLHISEMSWTRINNPSEVVKVGQKIQVVVLKLNLEQGRVSLGMRQILPDPWAHLSSGYKVGEIIEVTISRLVPFGAFVALEGGIEAIIPNSELSRRRVNRPEDVVSIGETLQAKIIDIKPEERRMTLSIRQVREDKEREEHDSYRQTSRPSSSEGGGRMTLGDLVGSQLMELQAGMADREAQEAEKPARKRAPRKAKPEGEAEAVIEEEIPEPETPTVEETAEIESPAIEETAEVEAPVAEAPEVEPVAETAEVKAEEAETE